MRKIFASMTAVSMAAAVMLAGCGSNSSDKKTTTAASTKATEAATEKKTEKETEKATEKASEEVRFREPVRASVPGLHPQGQSLRGML